MARGRKPIGKRAMTAAERQRRHRAKAQQDRTTKRAAAKAERAKPPAGLPR